MGIKFNLFCCIEEIARQYMDFIRMKRDLTAGFVIDMNITWNIHFPLSPVICLHLTSVLSNQRNSSNIAYGSLIGILLMES